MTKSERDLVDRVELVLGRGTAIALPADMANRLHAKWTDDLGPGLLALARRLDAENEPLRGALRETKRLVAESRCPYDVIDRALAQGSSMTKIPWNEAIPTFSIHGESADPRDVERLASEYMQQRKLMREAAAWLRVHAREHRYLAWAHRAADLADQLEGKA